MPCTTILIGKNASYDGSTMIARNDDSCSGAKSMQRRLLFSVNSFALMFYSAFNRQHSLFCTLLKSLLFAA